MRNDENISITRNLDWVAVGFYILFVFLGWLNIYAVVYDPEAVSNIFDFSINSGKQLMWIGGSFIIIVVILVIDYKFGAPHPQHHRQVLNYKQLIEQMGFTVAAYLCYVPNKQVVRVAASSS